MTRVLIIYRYIPDYRVAFFDALRQHLANDGIVLDVIYGRPSKREALKMDSRDLSWGTRTKNIMVPFGGRHLIYQTCLRRAMTYDVVIVEQAGRLLINYLLVIAAKVGGPRIGFWGHGRNMQASTALHAAEVVKRILIDTPQHWFAYTTETATYLEAAGVRSQRISVVNNTVDTTLIRRQVASSQIERSQRDILVLGSMYGLKRLDVLVDCARALERQSPLTRIILVGGGELAQGLAQRPNVEYRGRLDGAQKARELARCSLLFMPGLVGLAVVDAFAAGIPTIAFAGGDHSPEFAYLDASNSVILSPSATGAEAAAVIAATLDNRPRLAELSRGASETGSRLSLTHMVEAFAEGVKHLACQ